VSAVIPENAFDLARFVDAQQGVYDRAVAEICSGQKRSHWMWFVFPQYQGLGASSTSKYFAIRSLDEARAYLAHPVLGRRLVECAEALIGMNGRTAHEIFGSPDDLKLRSSATLFASVAPAGSVFHQVLDRYFGGQPDPATLRLIGE
jgi:uncharacterized protein (DUF1810 family)